MCALFNSCHLSLVSPPSFDVAMGAEIQRPPTTTDGPITTFHVPGNLHAPAVPPHPNFGSLAPLNHFNLHFPPQKPFVKLR